MTEAMTIIRSKFPALRRTRPTAIIHSGGKQTIFGCICGDWHTASTQYRGRDAKHVKEWIHAHAGCADTLLAYPGKLQLRRARVWIGAGGRVNPTVEPQP